MADLKCVAASAACVTTAGCPPKIPVGYDKARGTVQSISRNSFVPTPHQAGTGCAIGFAQWS